MAAFALAASNPAFGGNRIHIGIFMGAGIYVTALPTFPAFVIMRFLNARYGLNLNLESLIAIVAEPFLNRCASLDDMATIAIVHILVIFGGNIFIHQAFVGMRADVDRAARIARTVIDPVVRLLPADRLPCRLRPRFIAIITVIILDGRIAVKVHGIVNFLIFPIELPIIY